MEKALLTNDMKALKEYSMSLARTCDQMNGIIRPEGSQGSQPMELAAPEETQEEPEEEEEPENEDDIIKVDKKYDTMREIRLAAIEYGRRRKFAVSTLRSGARQLVLGCKHSGSYRGTKKAIQVVVAADSTTLIQNGSGGGDSPSSLPAIELEEKEDVTTTQNTETAENTTQQSLVSATDNSTLAVFPAAKRTRKKVTRKIQCPFQIRAKPVKGEWIIYKMITEHNHPMASESILYAQHRKLNQETTQEIVDLMRQNKSNLQIIEELKTRGIRNVVKKDIANIRQSYFNPKNNKLSATGNILFQVQEKDMKENVADCALSSSSSPSSVAVAEMAAEALIESSGDDGGQERARQQRQLSETPLPAAMIQTAVQALQNNSNGGCGTVLHPTTLEAIQALQAIEQSRQQQQ